ncbi:MAG: AAA family ATPase [Gammaproteobacteria bacterium]|jgi:type II secretory pathway predicted ATPase ExeA|nr:AAA family ATPase [Gammaproteobacteria bacterium]
MFESFYGMQEDPFRLSSDHRFCFRHRNYARARAYIDYALHRAEGFVMVTGNPGTGKTTLINQLVSELPQQTTRAATLLSTRLEAEDLLRMTAYSLGLRLGEQPKAVLLQQLMQRISTDYRRGVRTLLIIDEAQDLNASALEELRLLTNLHESGQPLLQILLVGQEPLRQLVKKPEMEQLHQRLIAAWHLRPLNPQETIGYVRHRLETAGWRGDPVFDPGVLESVFRFSQGVPRRINLICSRLLLHGCISERHQLTREDAHELLAELDAEELVPTVTSEPESAKASANDPDWSEIDQGLRWCPSDQESPVSRTRTAAMVSAQETAIQTAENQGRTAPSDSDADDLTAPLDVGKKLNPDSSSGPALFSAPDLPDSVETNVAKAADPEPAGVASSESTERQLSPLAGLTVEDPGDPSSIASTDPVVLASGKAKRSEKPRQLIRRRGPLIFGIIAFFALILVPAELWEWPIHFFKELSE